MKTLLSIIIALLALTSCSSVTEEPKPDHKKLVRAVQVYFSGSSYYCIDSAIILRRVDSMYAVGDVIRYSSHEMGEPHGYQIVQ